MGGATHVNGEKRALALGSRLVVVESLQWCANNAVYFLGLIGAATYDLGGDAFLVAGITLARNLATSVGNVLAGSIVDRVGPRLTVLGTLLFSAAASLLVGIVPLSMASLSFAAVFLGLSGGFINTATHAYPAYIETTLVGRQRLNGRMVFWSNIAYTLGPIAGGAVVSLYSTKAVYLFMTVAMGAAAVAAFGCREVVVPERTSRRSFGVLSGAADGARLTFSNPDLRIIFIAGFLGFFAFGAFDSLESLFYRDVLRVDIVWLGWLSSVVGATSSVGAWLLTKMPSERIGVGLLLLSLTGVGIGSMVYVGTDLLAVAIVGQAINGAAWGFLEPLQMLLVQERSSIAQVGRVMGFVRFGHMSAGVLPLLAAPFLAERLGVQPVLFGASCVIALVGCLLFVSHRRR